ncbi:hypothetical protein [Paenarthrobacter ureafaciens]|uniref:hypothetical protein n=1 Tax=Paenarthrobacter ureafaciens TaxID=37931 RepID=UPI0014092E82|nr:hypothetical protein [Paenarthrobacter ureafaciens]MCX8455334.1 hypothetical protein [Paenarthrobacter ureafaciens]MCY0974061.1 hypothetical protein [Paenarthrobacter ureafaciens]
MLSSTLTRSSADVTFSAWQDRFDSAPSVTISELEQFKLVTDSARYATTVLHLAREDKLTPEVLTDAVYSAWLYAENPKKALCGSAWAELFRLAYNPDHEFFEAMP